MNQRILVVDDDGLVLRSVAKVLSKAGYDVLTAVDVDSALRHAKMGVIDAALVDFTLSRETGLAVLAHLRDIQPRCVRILFTGRSDPAIMVEAVNRGEVTKVLRKPLEQHDLLEELKDAFDRARRNQHLAVEESSAKLNAERQDLEEALADKHLALALQPIFDLSGSTPQPFAFEALLRPKHPRINNPGLLLEMAERYDRICDVGSTVFHLARNILQQLASHHLLFINLHPFQLGHPARLAQDLRQLDGHCDRVVIEITEQSQLQKLNGWEESIHIINQSGCRIAIDDLGSGYSSLVILADLQPAYIKLDMSLVRNIHNEPRKQRLVALLRQFGDLTEAMTIAEGVETEGEKNALLDCGVRSLQGYYFARPSERFAPEWLRQAS